MDELGNLANSLGLSIIDLIACSEDTAVDKGKQLLSRTQAEIANESTKIDVISLIETIIFYKFPQKSRQELEKMFSLDDLKKTKVAQELLEEGREEGKLEVLPALVQRGFSLEEIAHILGLEINRVSKEVIS